jgi:hypothetical protein
MYVDSDRQVKPANDFYVVPLEPANLSRGITVYHDEEARPSTADIIAQQSQDYVDEKLAEYQATISLLQGKENNRSNYRTFPMQARHSHMAFAESRNATRKFSLDGNKLAV